MTIKTKIDFEKYLKLMYVLTYKNGWIIAVTIFGALMFLSSILHFSGLNSYSETPIFQLFFGIFSLIVLPASVYFSGKKTFESNKRLQENIIYEFDNNKMKITGESFNSELDLNKSYKIQELHNWFLIYQSKQVANFIPKYDLSPVEVNEIRNLFRQLTGIPLRLK